MPATVSAAQSCSFQGSLSGPKASKAATSSKIARTVLGSRHAMPLLTRTSPLLAARL